MTLNNCEEFAVAVRSLIDHFIALMKRYKSKTRREVKGTGLGGEELSENEQLLEDVIERFAESQRRTKADTEIRQSYIENAKKKAQEMRKQWKNLNRQENVRGKIKVTLGMKTN